MVNDVAIKSDNNELMIMSSGTLVKHFKALNNNDLEGALNMIHSDSPAQLPTRQMLGQMMNKFKLNYEFIDARQVGSDNEYIFIRMNQKTTKLDGPEYKNNITDLIVAMRQDEAVWKIWSVMPLKISFL